MGSDYKMDLYVKDFLTSTIDMSGPEAAAYLLTLAVAWVKGASLPVEPESIRRMVRYDPDEWAVVWPAIEKKWKVSKDGTYRTNGRQRVVMAETEKRIALRSQAGRKGNDVRWGLRSQADDFAIAKVSPSPSPSPSGREEKGERARFAPPSLEEIVEYGKEIPGLNAPAFFDFYASKGWKVGTAPMKDWRAAARRWRRKDAEDGKIPPPPKPDKKRENYLKQMEEQKP